MVTSLLAQSTPAMGQDDFKHKDVEQDQFTFHSTIQVSTICPMISFKVCQLLHQLLCNT